MAVSTRLTIIAGPCSIDYENIDEILKLLEIKVDGRRVISGVRVVGLKFRTKIDPTGEGMGIDYKAVMENLEILQKGGSVEDLKPMPSIKLAKQILAHANVIIATEIMMPIVQLPLYEKYLKGATLMPWNPAVDQLGWHVYQMGIYAGKNSWHVGIKNGKWVGEKISIAEGDTFDGETSIERTWKGLVTYAEEGIKRGIALHTKQREQDTDSRESQPQDSQKDGKGANFLSSSEIFLIQRGVDIPEKGNYRNYPIHNIAKRVKLATGKRLLFDPSHSLGPKMRDNIVEATVEAMKLKLDEDTYLYDGILIEVGTSKTDTDQHINLEEFELLVEELAKIRRV